VDSSGWGRSDGRSVGNGVGVNYLAEPPAPNSTSWIGEQADPWGDGLPSKESRRSHRRKNGVDSSGWGRLDGQPIERVGRAENSAVAANWGGVYTTRPFSLEECGWRGGSGAGQGGSQAIKATRSYGNWMFEGNGKESMGGLGSKDDTIEAEDKAYQAALNAIVVEATRMAAQKIAQREATGICPIEAEALGTHMVDDGDDDGDDAPTPTEWMLWYADTRKEARSHNALLEQHKVSPRGGKGDEGGRSTEERNRALHGGRRIDGRH